MLIAAVLILPALLLQGCGLLRWAYAPERASRHRITQTSGASADADVVVAQPEIRPDTASVKVAPPRVRRREPTSRPPAGPTTQTPDTTAVEQAPDSAPREPPISVVLPEVEKRQLVKSTRRELDEAVTILRRMGGRLESAEAIEKKQTVQGLVDQSREALERDDVGAAANLARKARILAIELLSLQ
jgi:hypothetical protein